MNIPERYEVWQPPIIEKQTANNCVAQVLSNIGECILYQETGKHIECSVGYIYGNPLNTEKQGMQPNIGMKIFYEDGFIERDIWECGFENPKCRNKYKEEVTNEIKANAHKIKDYVRIWTLAELQEHIMKYNLPVLISAKYQYLNGVGSDLHAVTCYGWDERGLLYTNSWGTGGIYGDGKGIVQFKNLHMIWGVIPMELNTNIINPVGPTDIAGHWAENDIQYLFNKGIVRGYEDGSIKPNDPITRAEVFTLLARVLKASEG